MYNVSIYNDITNRSYGARFESESEMNAWIESCKAKNSWGKPERELTELTPELESRVISTRTVISQDIGQEIIDTTFYLIKADYTIEIKDLTLDYDWQLQECYRKRLDEYPSIQVMVEALYEEDNARISELKTQRAAVKTKHKKPVRA